MTSLQPDGDKWLTVEQVAREMGYHPKTILAKIRAGIVPGVTIGNKVRIPRVQYEQYQAGTWQPRRSIKPVDLIHRKTA